MGYSNNEYRVVDDLENHSITKNMEEGSAKWRVVR